MSRGSVKGLSSSSAPKVQATGSLANATGVSVAIGDFLSPSLMKITLKPEFKDMSLYRGDTDTSDSHNTTDSHNTYNRTFNTTTDSHDVIDSPNVTDSYNVTDSNNSITSHYLINANGDKYKIESVDFDHYYGDIFMPSSEGIYTLPLDMGMQTCKFNVDAKAKVLQNINNNEADNLLCFNLGIADLKDGYNKLHGVKKDLVEVIIVLDENNDGIVRTKYLFDNKYTTDCDNRFSIGVNNEYVSGASEINAELIRISEDIAESQSEKRDIKEVLSNFGLELPASKQDHNYDRFVIGLTFSNNEEDERYEGNLMLYQNDTMGHSFNMAILPSDLSENILSYSNEFVDETLTVSDEVIEI